IGLGTAWLVARCEFPARRVLAWALLLPLAMPGYLAAYAYTDILEYSGPVQSVLRGTFGWHSRQDYWFPEVRSLGGAILFLSLVLYPYVYLLARTAFSEQSGGVMEAGRSLGRGPWGCFFTLALPLARPAIVVGLTLALMETLNDFGTVDYFAVPTFTVGIYRVWLGMGSTAGAAQLAALLVGIVLLLTGLERLARRQQRFHHTTQRTGAPPRFTLRGMPALMAFLAGLLPVVLGFGVPAGLLIAYTLDTWRELGPPSVAAALGNSLLLAGLTAAATVITGLFLAYGVRLRPWPLMRAATRAASLGYAVPGLVLAVGVMIPAAALDNALDAFLRARFGVSSGLLLSGTLAALVFACTVRFLPLALGAAEAGLARITPAMDHAARSLGVPPREVLRRVHVPLLKGSVMGAALLVFVDTVKELPMTLLLRPFNFNTLSTHVYEQAASEQFRQAAPAALAIVLAGLAPVLLLGLGRHRPQGQPPIPSHAQTKFSPARSSGIGDA
ncbi:MAG: iron ABC transporter permease, partial [Deltaproteobacteria bacterium]|nr:iron ABC transporter permease [Deltaproteobacteria bacterium]